VTRGMLDRVDHRLDALADDHCFHLRHANHPLWL
jgi:hypothetical protein